MPLSPELLTAVTCSSSEVAWQAISSHLWETFSADLPSDDAVAEIVRRDAGLTELDNVVSGSAWELWNDFVDVVPRSSASLVDFWKSTPNGKAVLILDGLSLRESPWLLSEAGKRGFKIHTAGCRASELPAETTPFAKSLGFSQRSSLDNNGAGGAHKLSGAATACGNLNWRDCVELIGSQTGFVFWHHWPDHRMHELAGPGASLRKLAQEAEAALTSDGFWALVDRLTTGRRLVITSDHGYAACGQFHNLSDKDQVEYMKTIFKNGRSAASDGLGDARNGAWMPPIDLRLTTSHGAWHYVLGRQRWKSPAGYPTLAHGGLSLLEVFVPFIELSK